MNKSFWIGLFAGCVFGSVMGLIFAPGKGIDTRQRLADAAEPAKDKVVGMATRFKVKVIDRGESIKQAI